MQSDQTTTVQISKKIHKDIRKLADAQGKKVRAVVEELLREGLLQRRPLTAS